jgi:hypothetical protein
LAKDREQVIDINTTIKRCIAHRDSRWSKNQPRIPLRRAVSISAEPAIVRADLTDRDAQVATINEQIIKCRQPAVLPYERRVVARVQITVANDLAKRINISADRVFEARQNRDVYKTAGRPEES